MKTITQKKGNHRRVTVSAEKRFLIRLRAVPTLSMVVISTLVVGSAPAGAACGDQFAMGTGGWTEVAYPFRSHVETPTTAPATHDPGFGLPAGSVRVFDVFAETGIAAPPCYLGNQAAQYGGNLTYDIYIRFSDGVTYPAVVLNSGTNSIYFDAPSPPLNSWDSRVVPLTEVGWLHSGLDTAVTETEFRQILSELVGVYIYTEWKTGPDETNVDNITWGGGTGVQLELTGPCPGIMTVDITGLSPNAGFALIGGSYGGTDLIPGGMCGGVPTILTTPTLLVVGAADPFGEASLSANIPAGFCAQGLGIQAVDGPTCRISNGRPLAP